MKCPTKVLHLLKQEDITEILSILQTVDIGRDTTNNNCISKIKEIAINNGLSPEMAYDLAKSLVELELMTIDKEF